VEATLAVEEEVSEETDEAVEEENAEEEEKPDEALITSLKILDNLMKKIEIADRKIGRHGSLKDLKKLIAEKKKRMSIRRSLRLLQKRYRTNTNGWRRKSRSR